jgi:hypothetical protein
MAYITQMRVSVVETAGYLSKAAKIMSQEEMAEVVDFVSLTPLAGEVIKGTGGLRKLRVGLQGRGKRGGGRVIYWFYNKGYPAVLLWAFAKNEASDLTTSQRKQLAQVTESFLNDFGSDT